MLSPQFVDNKELRVQASALNKSGALAEDKIIKKIIGKKRDELVKEFMEAVNSVPEGSEEEKKLPESVINFYNSIFDGQDPSEEKQKKIADAKKAKAEKKPRGPSFEKKAYDLIKQMQGEGKTEKEIADVGFVLYTELYSTRKVNAKDPSKEEDAKFIQDRTNIYLKIAYKDIKADAETETGGASE